MRNFGTRSDSFPLVPPLVPERDGGNSFPFPSLREGTSAGTEWTEKKDHYSFPRNMRPVGGVR